MRNAVLQLWPEIEWIQDAELREKVTKVWQLALERSPLTPDDLHKILFTLLVPNCPTTFMKHKRCVVHIARKAAESMTEFMGNALPIDRDAVIAGAILADVGIMRDGFSFQAGAGGVALAFVDYLARMMREAGVRASFVRGGSTKYLVDMLKEGLIGYILDGQTFDLDAVRSRASDPRHVMTSPFTFYNGKGNFASIVDAAVLGATEVDLNFIANVVTHSDGRLLHGIGGWQNCLFKGCTILAVPSFRDRIPVIVDEVTTLTGPGELVDVIVTERGIAIN
jgi:citrate lyase alpha subunit